MSAASVTFTRRAERATPRSPSTMTASTSAVRRRPPACSMISTASRSSKGRRASCTAATRPAARLTSYRRSRRSASCRATHRQAYGNYNTVDAEGAINLPVGRDGGVPPVGDRGRATTAILSDGTSDEKTWAGRAQLKAELTPDLTVRIAADFAHNGGLTSGIDYLRAFMPAASRTSFRRPVPLGTGVNARRRARPFARRSCSGRSATICRRCRRCRIQDNTFYGVTNAEIDYKTPRWNADCSSRHGATPGAAISLGDAGAIPLSRPRRTTTSTASKRGSPERASVRSTITIGGYYFDERHHRRSTSN